MPKFDSKNRLTEMSKIFDKLMKDKKKSIQVWVYFQEESEFRKNYFSSISETGVNAGVELF